MYAFLSYQTADKIVAGHVQKLLDGIGIKAFLAHEDIQVSHEWRTTILEEIGKADVFIPILSKHYFLSPWCVQESGIAAFRDGLCIIPLSLDGSIPPGFISNIQSTKVDPENILLKDLLPGLAKKDFALVFDILTRAIKSSGSYRGAEANFERILPFIPRATDEQIAALLKASTVNGEVMHASLCATKYLPPLLASHGHLLDDETRAELGEVLARYA
ncbi:hypothetical protein J2728_001152 [Caulobacter segnis]|nr:hypothetical protein [Caulobacter segnis]